MLVVHLVIDSLPFYFNSRLHENCLIYSNLLTKYFPFYLGLKYFQFGILDTINNFVKILILG